MEQTVAIYEGKAKLIYAGPEPHTVIMRFKDDLTAFNALKKSSFEGKGQANAQISSLIFGYLKNQGGVGTHLLKVLSADEWLCQKLEIIPFEVVVRNKVAGSMAKRLDLAEGTTLKSPLVEFYLKNDQLGDPFISKDQILALGWESASVLQEIETSTLKINQLLQKLFKSCDLELVDFKIEFGRNSQGQVLLADEISPDSCRLWDIHTQEKLDKDRFRRDLGNIKEAYLEVLNRIEKVVAREQ